jgi:maltose/moltooligosaccharide transporter
MRPSGATHGLPLAPDRRVTIFGLGVAFCLSVVVTQILSRFLPLVLQGAPETGLAAGMGALVAMAVFSLDNLVQMVVQPWAGRRSDRTSGRFGRRIPWVVAGLPGIVAGFVLIAFAPNHAVTLVGLLCCSLGVSFLRVPAVVLTADLFPGPERASANGRVRAIGVILNMALVLGITLLFNVGGAEVAFVCSAIACMALVTIVVATVAEPPGAMAMGGPPPTLTSRTSWPADAANLFAVSALGAAAYGAYNYAATSYGVFALGLGSSEAVAYSLMIGAAFALGAAPAGQFARHWSNRTAIIAGLGLWGASFSITALAQPSGVLAFSLLNLAFGLGFALFNIGTMTAAMNLGGATEAGRYTGLLFLFSQIGLIVGPFCAGLAIDVGGGDYGNLPMACLAFCIVALIVATIGPSGARPPGVRQERAYG